MLTGHSAGAHLCALTLLFLIDTREELFIETKKQQEVALSIKGVIGKYFQLVFTITNTQLSGCRNMCAEKLSIVL